MISYFHRRSERLRYKSRLRRTPPRIGNWFAHGADSHRRRISTYPDNSRAISPIRASGPQSPAPCSIAIIPDFEFTSGFLIAGELPSSTPPAALGASTVPPQNPPAPAILARMLVPDQPPQPKGAREPLRKSVSAQCTTLNRRMEMHSGVCRLHLNRGRFDLPGYYA
jgi:hypothetical protein